jgi:hypothetical protein
VGEGDIIELIFEIIPLVCACFIKRKNYIKYTMLIIHATQKLLNVSRLEAPLYISKATEGQMLHSWYCSLLPTGFPGKLMLLYVHEPSLLTIVCRGKTIHGTWDEFKLRLPKLLKKFNFQSSFIELEIALANEFVVSKTNSRSMLAHINQMKLNLQANCMGFDSYANISQDFLEENMMDYLYSISGKSNSFRTAMEYWKEQKAIL